MEAPSLMQISTTFHLNTTSLELCRVKLQRTDLERCSAAWHLQLAERDQRAVCKSSKYLGARARHIPAMLTYHALLA